ncbi:helix-turn-helix domain-containing protein [Microbacterium sp. NPDC057659]|uniref:helix-turn-helix domain-containing protein n=1 Tax=Microbacterium sp. NPDC057659 TaxID=3346198 RepID=UPI003672A17F
MAAEELSTAQLRVLSHPTRLAFLRRLRENGPATSRSLGREFDLDSGAASYHLRRLAAGGLIVEDPALGTQRERWWRAAEDFSQFDPARHDDGSARRYMQSVILAAADELQRVASAVPGAEPEWLTESAFVDQRIALDGERRQQLRAELMAVIDRYRSAAAAPAGPLTQVRFQIYEQR